MKKDARYWRFYYAIQEVLAGNKEYLSEIDTQQEGIGDIKPFSKLPTQLLRDAERLATITLRTTVTDDWSKDRLFMKYIHSNPRLQNMMIMDLGYDNE